MSPFWRGRARSLRILGSQRSMFSQPKSHREKPAFAIIRIDPHLGRDEDRATVTRIVWDEETAVSEVERLNELNAGRYVWQATRAAPRT